MSKKKKTTTDAVEIIHQRYFKGHVGHLAALAEERANAEVARKIYELREKSGLTQRQLAQLVGTTASVICRLEDADYEGHSLAMLNRIAAALNRRVEIAFKPVRVVGRQSRSAAFRIRPTRSKELLPPTPKRQTHKRPVTTR
jgi:transcriptional regulator with XRE-family HTH domain